MTADEFSSTFDTMLNSYAVTNKFGDVKYNASIELDEYEKSVLLTKAQDELVKSIYGIDAANSISFEATESARRSLNQLVLDYSTSTKITTLTHSYPNSCFFQIPDSCWFIVYERVVFANSDSIAMVKPLAHDSLFKNMNNPFKQPSLKRVFRLDITNNTVEMITNNDISEYRIRYVVRPQPIVLTDIGDLNINGVSVKTECELNSLVHNDILNLAVKMCLERIAPSHDNK
jgi:hypothetical protein